MTSTFLALVVCMTTVCGVGQEVIDPGSVVEFAGLTHKELTRRIFDGEREMVDQLTDARPILETYLQGVSLDDGTVLDDAYFLSRVDFSHNFHSRSAERKGRQEFLIGRARSSRYVQIDSKHRWRLRPNGYLDMLFVDIDNFDADTYDLAYAGREPVGTTACLRFSVTPREQHINGRFVGTVWVEATSYKIVRIKGTFTPFPQRKHRSRDLTYFHFDSLRQRVEPGVWRPAFAYFDEKRPESNHPNQFNFHIRGNTFMWGYGSPAAKPDQEKNIVSRLDTNILLARPDVTERHIDSLIQHLARGDTQIHCRILLTTPVEMFSFGKTVVVSRGLLNILPTEDDLTVLLAREVARIDLGITDEEIFAGTESTFFTGLGPVPSNSRENEVLDLSLALLHGIGISSSTIQEWSDFLAELHAVSPRIHNLLKPRFGFGILSSDPTPATHTTKVVVLGNKYAIDVLNNRIVSVPGTRTNRE